MSENNLLPVSNMASSGLRKMFTLIISNTGWCHSVGVSCNFMDTFCCYYASWQHMFCIWQMLLPCCLIFCGRCYNHQVDVVTCYLVCGRCCNHQADVIACIVNCLVDVYHILLWLMLLPLFVIVVKFMVGDVIARVADVVATGCNYCIWQMLLPRWLMLLPLFVMVLLAGVIAKWLMLLPLIIIALQADVVAKVADVIATICDSFWQMLLPRWLMECLPWV